jgi:hypothetical protein
VSIPNASRNTTNATHVLKQAKYFLVVLLMSSDDDRQWSKLRKAQLLCSPVNLLTFDEPKAA